MDVDNRDVNVSKRDQDADSISAPIHRIGLLSLLAVVLSTELANSVPS